MRNVTFEANLLSDGHLYCPEEYARRDNARFRVTVTFDEPPDARDDEIELAALTDVSDGLLSEEEIDYYLNLDEP